MFSFNTYILTKLFILRANYYIIQYSLGSHSSWARQDKICPFEIILLVDVQEITSFMEGNRFHVQMNVRK